MSGGRRERRGLPRDFDLARNGSAKKPEDPEEGRPKDQNAGYDQPHQVVREALTGPQKPEDPCDQKVVSLRPFFPSQGFLD